MNNKISKTTAVLVSLAAVFVVGQAFIIQQVHATTVCINVASNSVSGSGHHHGGSFSIHQSISQSNNCSGGGGTNQGGGGGGAQH